MLNAEGRNLMEAYGLLIAKEEFAYKARKSNSCFHPFDPPFISLLARGTCLVFPDTGVVSLLFQRLKNFDSTKPSTPTVHSFISTCFQDRFSSLSLLSLFPFRPFPKASSNVQYASSLFLTSAH